MVENEQISYEKVIFSGIFFKSDEVEKRKRELVSAFNTPSVFKNEFYIFFLIVKEFPRITINEEFLKLYLRTNRSLFLNNANIDLTQFAMKDTEPYIEFLDCCVAVFNDCRKENIDDETYYRAIEMHKMNYVNDQSITILEESAIILSEGLTVRGRFLSGYDDMRKNLRYEFLKIDNMVEQKDRKGIIMYGINDEEEDASGKVKFVTTFGIEDLDDAVGGIYEGDMVSLLAPAKGGKSRFATFIVHNAVVNHGVNVVVWSIENGYKGWEALIRARHFNYFYNSQITDVAQKRFIDDDLIRKGDLSQEMQELELASWTDLKHNNEYGRIANIDEDFYADSFMEVIDNAVMMSGAKLVMIDYLQLLVEGDTGVRGSRSKNERIGNAYIKMLQYLKQKKIGGIFPAQFKQTVVTDLSKLDDGNLINAEMRDSAGETYEVIKTPDVNIGLYGSAEDIKNGYLKILSIPSRNHAPFEPIDIYADLGASTFTSVRK